MELTYKQEGEVLLPNLIPTDPQSEPLGKYGMKRMRFLEEEHPLIYEDYLASGYLMKHLNDIENRCLEQLAVMMEQAEKKLPPPDRDKFPLEWARYKSSLKAELEQILYQELIYV